MAEFYNDNNEAAIPTPNRFLVTKEQIDAIDNMSEAGSGSTGSTQSGTSTIPGTGTTESAISTDDINIDSALSLLLGAFNLTAEDLGNIIKDYSYIKSEITQLQDRITLRVSEGSEIQALGIGDIDGLYTKIKELTSEIEMLKSSIKMSVSSTDFESIETVIDSSLVGMAQQMNNNIAVIAEQITQAEASVGLFKEEIELRVGEVTGSSMYTNGNNDDPTTEWINTVALYNATLNQFEYTDASGWVGDGSPQFPFALRFNGNQFLSITNSLHSQTPSTQAFTIEAFVKLQNYTGQKLANVGNGIYLADSLGFPKVVMNSSSNEISYEGLGAIAVNIPVHIVFRFSVQEGVIDLHVNNSPIPGTINWTGSAATSMPLNIFIGEGMIADLYVLRVYDGIISLDDVKANYEQGITGENFCRERLVVNLDARKAESLVRMMTNSRAEIEILKESIGLTTEKVTVIEQGVIDTNSRIDDVEANVTYSAEVFSTNGLLFRNGIINTKLIAMVKHGGTDITGTLDSSRFIWTRTSLNPEADIVWNQSHLTGAKEIFIGVEDVTDQATFVCTITDPI